MDETSPAQHAPEVRRHDGRRSLWRGIAVTAGIVVGLWALPRIYLPGIHVEMLFGARGIDWDSVGPFALGLTPVLTAFYLVEVATLLVPRWRPLRIGGHETRDRLWARTRILALILTAVQAYVYAVNIQGLKVLDAGLGNCALVVVTLMGGTCLLMWLARLISEHGIANGFSVLLAANAAPRLLAQISVAALQPDVSAPQLLEGVLWIVLPVGVLLWSMRRPSFSGDTTTPPRLMLPASGILPLNVAASLLLLPASMAGLGWVAPERVALIAPGSTLRWGIEGALALVLCPLYAWAFHRPRQVARLWARSTEQAGGTAGAEGMEGTARQALGVAILKTLGILALFVFATGGGKGRGLAVDIMSLTLVVAVLLDVIGEARFQRAQGRLSSVWPVHRAYAVHASLRVLARAGIPARPRGLHHRSLGHFFVPFVPVEILVPESQAEEAHALLEALLLGPS